MQSKCFWASNANFKIFMCTCNSFITLSNNLNIHEIFLKQTRKAEKCWQYSYSLSSVLTQLHQRINEGKLVYNVTSIYWFLQSLVPIVAFEFLIYPTDIRKSQKIFYGILNESLACLRLNCEWNIADYSTSTWLSGLRYFLYLMVNESL